MKSRENYDARNHNQLDRYREDLVLQRAYSRSSVGLLRCQYHDVVFSAEDLDMDNNNVTPGLENYTGRVIDSNVYIVSAFFQLAASVASLLGNSLLIISVFKFEYLRDTTHVLVVLLACFDLGIGVSGLLEQCTIMLSVYKGELNGMRTFCLIMTVIFSGMGTGDLLSVMFIAIDRFIYITYPLRYTDIVTRRKITYVVVFIVVYSPITSIISAVSSNYTEGLIVCKLTQIMLQSHSYLLFVEGVFVGLVFIIFYGQIVHLACKKARQVQQEDAQNSISGDNSILQRQLKVTRVLSLIIGVFIATNVCLGVTFAVFIDTKSTTIIIIHTVAELIWKVGIMKLHLHNLQKLT